MSEINISSLAKKALEENPTVYISNMLKKRMNGLNIEELIYFAEKGANLYNNLAHTAESTEMLKKDQKLAEIIAKWGE